MVASWMFFNPCAISNAVLRALKPASASPTIAFPILQKWLISGRRLALPVVLKFRGIVTTPRASGERLFDPDEA
jgi:hypothetical protein